MMESESAGALAWAGQRLNFPLAQKVSIGQGMQLLPVDALPSYPGRHVHWVTEVLPSGEIEFAGHEAGMSTGGDALAKPSTVRLALSIAAWVLLMSFVAITTENETESVVTCSRLRPLDRAVTVVLGAGLTAGGLPINSNPRGTGLPYEKEYAHDSDVRKR